MSKGFIMNKQLQKIKYLVIDVDGTMTDAGIYYDEQGNEWKKFCTKDAAGFFAAHQVGIRTIILTGRECIATTRRMQEMKVDYLVQNVKDKRTYLIKFMKDHSLKKEQLGYIGDDLNDLSGMELCGFVGCPKDACAEVKVKADYISGVKGGQGAVRDIIEFLLRERDEWSIAITEVYGIGI